MTDGDDVTPQDIDRLAQLQIALLPSSMVSRLGRAYARAFFRFAIRSPLEILTVERDAGGHIIAGCVVSLDVGSLSRRLALQTPLMPAVLLRPWVLLSAFGGDGGPGAGETELVHLFTDPAAQGSGAATRLVERCDAMARKNGLASYVVRTFSDPADPVHRFYVKRGFRAVAEFSAYGSSFSLLRRTV